MKKTSMLCVSAVTLATLTLFGCQSVQDKVPADTLVAAYTSAAPNPAAGAADPVWAKASQFSPPWSLSKASRWFLEKVERPSRQGW